MWVAGETSKLFSPGANPPLGKSFESALVLCGGEPPETTAGPSIAPKNYCPFLQVSLDNFLIAKGWL
jgi:hypothetical protein